MCHAENQLLVGAAEPANESAVAKQCICRTANRCAPGQEKEGCARGAMSSACSWFEFLHSVEFYLSTSVHQRGARFYKEFW